MLNIQNTLSMTMALQCSTLVHNVTYNVFMFVVRPSLTTECVCVFVNSDYLLSNNHVNSIIVLKLDFSDEEVLAYYISFLKTLSFKLNKHTIHFFYNEHLRDFPLYTEAIKFFNHSESMVRIAVRTLTLNVYKGWSSLMALCIPLAHSWLVIAAVGSVREGHGALCV